MYNIYEKFIMLKIEIIYKQIFLDVCAKKIDLKLNRKSVKKRFSKKWNTIQIFNNIFFY